MSQIVSVLAVGTGPRLLSQQQGCVHPLLPSASTPAPMEAPRPEEVALAQGTSSADSFSKSHRAAASLLQGEPRKEGRSALSTPRGQGSCPPRVATGTAPTFHTRQ